MAESGTIVTLKDRGQNVLTSIDLFDEGVLGAGQTIFRARYNTIEEVKDAISAVLTKSPIEEEGKATSVLSVNRFKTNNVHGLRNYYPGDLYPEKSRWLVHFLLRFNFGSNDFCYIDLGLNWAPFRLANGKLNPDYPLGNYKFGQIFNITDLKILRVCMCTVDDAVELIKDLGLTDPTALEIVDVTAGITPEQLDNLETEGSVMAVNIHGEEQVLVKDNDILTANE